MSHAPPPVPVITCIIKLPTYNIVEEFLEAIAFKFIPRALERVHFILFTLL